MQHGHDRNPMRKMTPTPKDEKINSPVNSTIVTQVVYMCSSLLQLTVRSLDLSQAEKTMSVMSS